jgi:hypothetical protein
MAPQMDELKGSWMIAAQQVKRQDSGTRNMELRLQRGSRAVGIALMKLWDSYAVGIRLIGFSLLLVFGGCGRAAGPASPNAIAATDPRLAAIRQAGYPVTLAEVNAWYAQTPEAENSARLYLEAFDALAPGEPSSPEEFVSNNQKALTLLHQAATGKPCRYPMDLTQGYKVELPHLRKLKECAWLLAEAATNQVVNGQMEQATQSILDSLRLARSLENEPAIISRLVLMASEVITERSLEFALNHKGLTEDQLARLQAGFKEAESETGLARALAGERCFGITAFQMPADELTNLFTLARATPPADLATYLRSAAFASDYDFYLKWMGEAVVAATLPYPKSLDAFEQWSQQVEEAKAKGYEISALILANFRNVPVRPTDNAARLRLAQVALAIERYRLAHANAAPDSLGQLVPAWLAAVPLDPYDGQPVRYSKASPREYIVYSVGRDRTDNGGKAGPAASRNDPGFDLVFAVKQE